MKKIFSTPIETTYTLASIVLMIMILFPPYYQQFENFLFFRGYKFIFDSDIDLIDTSRLLLQFVTLGIVVVTIKRILAKM